MSCYARLAWGLALKGERRDYDVICRSCGILRYSGPILLYTYFLGISAAIRATSPPMSKLVAHQQTLDGKEWAVWYWVCFWQWGKICAWSATCVDDILGNSCWSSDHFYRPSCLNPYNYESEHIFQHWSWWFLGNYRRAQARLVSHHEEIAFLNGGAAEVILPLYGDVWRILLLIGTAVERQASFGEWLEREARGYTIPSGLYRSIWS